MLWERSFTPSASPFDTLIREALIEQRSTSTTTTTAEGAVSRWDKDAHSLLWLLANDLDLVFCVAYQRILSLPYVADLLEAIRRAFLKAYRETVEAIVESTRGKDVLVLGGAGGGKAAFGLFGQKGWQKVFAGWDETFNRILRDFEANAAKVRPLRLAFASLADEPSLAQNKKTTKTRTAAIADSPSSSPGDSEATSSSRFSSLSSSRD